MKVKICGLCRPEDAAAAATVGADYLGVVLAPGGPRTQSPEGAAAVLDGARDFVRGGEAVSPPGRVGVFVDASPDEILAAVRIARLDVVQLHGAEPPVTVRAVRDAGVVVWKAIRIRDRSAFLDGVERYADFVDAFLLDGWAPHAPGGVGARFDWDDIAAARHRVPGEVDLWIAGGLTPATVASAIQALDPVGVDVSSGVEVSRCVKSAELMGEFVRAAKTAAGGRGDRGAAEHGAGQSSR